MLTKEHRDNCTGTSENVPGQEVAENQPTDDGGAIPLARPLEVAPETPAHGGFVPPDDEAYKPYWAVWDNIHFEIDGGVRAYVFDKSDQSQLTLHAENLTRILKVTEMRGQPTWMQKLRGTATT